MLVMVNEAVCCDAGNWCQTWAWSKILPWSSTTNRSIAWELSEVNELYVVVAVNTEIDHGGGHQCHFNGVLRVLQHLVAPSFYSEQFALCACVCVHVNCITVINLRLEWT